MGSSAFSKVNAKRSAAAKKLSAAQQRRNKQRNNKGRTEQTK